MSAKITLIGFYNYDPTLFDGLTLPDGIEKDLVVDEILERSGEFESLYSNPDFVKNRITMWGRKHYRTFDKWIKALNIDYNPLENYDRFEEYTDSHVGNELLSGNRSDTYQNAQSAENDTKRANNSIINELSKDSSNESGNAVESSVKSGESSDNTSGSSNNIENIRSSNNGVENIKNSNNEIENSINSGTSTEHTDSNSNGVNAKLDNSNVVSNSHSVDDIKPVEQTTTKEHKVAAYDSNTYQPSAQDTDSNVVNVNGKDENSTDSITGTNGNAHEIATSTGSEDKNGGNNSSSNKINDSVSNSDKVSGSVESSDKITGSAESSDSYHKDSEGFSNLKSDVRTADNDRNASSFTANNGSEKNESKYADVHAGHELYNDNKLLKDETKHSAHLYGNIGVTTSQQMLQAELDVQRFNIYTQIADLFVQDFCIMLY